ncbi:hypothetical protein CAEBREN_09368 [Caenorhabditis brenneri]|uniref:Uncharacterized protein n=1 Tax=Caenorhabditis brenneri TaxID=135651 RepID=G0NEU9_CAEBE|nr:hypothetical protein CAEBREN_09368 [Caenorhabditis brenneri]
MDQNKPPTSLEELIRAACLNRLEKVKKEKPHEYKKTIESVRRSGGHLPSEQKIKNDMKEVEKLMRDSLIKISVNRECPGLGGLLKKEHLDVIMKEKYPPTMSDELVRRACIYRLEQLKRASGLYDMYGKAYTDALASVKAAGGYLPPGADDQSVMSIGSGSARSTTELLK